VKWTRSTDIKAQIERYWQRGDICRAAVGQGDVFPLLISLSKPSAKVMLEQFSAMQDWVKEILAYASKHGLRVDYSSISHRVLGKQALPVSLRIESPQHAARLMGQCEALRHFVTLEKMTCKRLPELQAWLWQHPLKALELNLVWEQILNLCIWMVQHPNPSIYLRQVDVEKVDSKFIEQHKRVLTALFDVILPVFAIDDEHTGAAGFARRYGFRDKPSMLRLRPLDTAISLIPSDASQDVVMTDKTFARLDLSVRQHVTTVFVVENEINYLSFPDYDHALLIFGSGYGFEALKQAIWLQDCAMYYWGDMDTHGFAIFNQLRASFPHAQSLLMDEQTLRAHQYAWVTEPKQEKKDLKYLQAEEVAMYDILRFNILADRLRLEQERISFAAVNKAVMMLKQAESHGEKQP